MDRRKFLRQMCAGGLATFAASLIGIVPFVRRSRRAAMIVGAFAIGPLAAAGFSTMLHTLLEVQEIYGDQVLGTKNVRGIMDTANDLMAGLVGATLFVLLTGWHPFQRGSAATTRQAMVNDEPRDPRTLRALVVTGAAPRQLQQRIERVSEGPARGIVLQLQAAEAELRAMELPGLTLLVDGGTAEIVDVVDLMYADFPKAIALVVGATYLVLLVLFRKPSGSHGSMRRNLRNARSPLLIPLCRCRRAFL